MYFIPSQRTESIKLGASKFACYIILIYASVLSKQNHVVRNDKTMVFIPAISNDTSSILWLLCFVRPRQSVTFFFFAHAVTFCGHTYHLFDKDLGCYVDLL